MMKKMPERRRAGCTGDTMKFAENGQRWVYNEEIDIQPAGEGVQRKILAYGSELMCVENYFETGAAGALHSHPHTQITYVVEGVFEFTIGEETKIVKKGDTLLKQNGVEHGCVCKQKEPCVRISCKLITASADSIYSK